MAAEENLVESVERPVQTVRRLDLANEILDSQQGSASRFAG